MTEKTGKKIRALVVVGTRPEAIKMAPVVKALADRNDADVHLALTGQHTTLVDQALAGFGLKADHDLNIMTDGQTLFDVARGCLNGLPAVMTDFDPHAVLIQGDTATVFFAALSAFFIGAEKIAVGHVEAGLRSERKWAPYPEEIFRRLTDLLADFHFAPTVRAGKRLREEISAQWPVGDQPAVHVTGNTVVDALLDITSRELTPQDPKLRSILEEADRLVLLTAHRRESFGAPVREVFQAAREIVERVPDVELLYPVHPNPNVRDPAYELLVQQDRIHLLEPLSYLDIVAAMKRADLILTDSGGIQEEAPTFGVPVLVLREVTERPEGIDAGVAELVGTDRRTIVDRAMALLSQNAATGARPVNPYGDGYAGVRIADILVSHFTGAPRQTEDWGTA